MDIYVLLMFKIFMIMKEIKISKDIILVRLNLWKNVFKIFCWVMVRYINIEVKLGVIDGWYYVRF